jgi:cell division protein FtsI (penicillin-binding protein 3)
VGLPIYRLLLVWGILLLGMLGLAYRLYQLQVVQADKLQRQARAQQTTSLQPYIPRRSVIDSLGNVLATDRLMYVLYVHPKLFKASANIPDPKQHIAEQLALILGDTTPQALLARFQQQQSGIKLATRLSESQASKIQALGLDGLELEKQYARFYPQDEMAADVVGYVDGDHRGQAGIELSQKPILERNALSFSIRRAGNGTILPASLPQDLLQSNDWQLQLTLDLRLQRATREILREQVKKYQAKRATVLVMDAQDGSILAMANEPTFNPNQYYKSKVEYFKNWTVSDLYEPGSTFKPVNIAIALDEKVIAPDDRVSDPGSVKVGPWTIFNASKSGGGLISITEVIRSSSNVGMVAIMRRLQPERYYHLLQAAGLDQKTGIDLPGEVPSYLKAQDEFVKQTIEPATASFGQGLSITPIKLVQLQAAIANGGKLVTPHVVKGLVDARYNLHWQPDYPVKTVFRPESSQAVAKMMEAVVDGGTGKAAYISGYRIGGKTGTAQKAGPRGGYLPNAKITSFVSILPVDNPRYVVAAIFDEPKGPNTFGGTVAAPVVKKVMEALIAIKGIPPSGSQGVNSAPNPQANTATPIRD